MERLRILKLIFENGFMDTQEFERRRVQIIDQSTGTSLPFSPHHYQQQIQQQQQQQQQQIQQQQQQQQIQQQQIQEENGNSGSKYVTITTDELDMKTKERPQGYYIDSDGQWKYHIHYLPSGTPQIDHGPVITQIGKADRMYVTSGRLS